MPEPSLAAELAPWITLAVVVAAFAWLRADIHRSEARQNECTNQMEARQNERMDQMEARQNERMDQMEARLNARMDRMEARMDGIAEALQEIRDRLSRLEGKVDFLEAWIIRRNEPAAPAE